jgi:hypothetical protein
MQLTAQSIRQSRPGALIGLTFTGILTGAVLGALTNSINSLVSPDYYRNILHWYDVQDIWRAGIAQGIFEGLLFGLLFSLIFTFVVGVVSAAHCPYGVGVRYILFVFLAAMGCWILGGLLGIGLAFLSPEFYCHTFRDVPKDMFEMLSYAWVGGSIWGIEFGGFAFCIIGSILFRAKWRQLIEGDKSETHQIRSKELLT